MRLHGMRAARWLAVAVGVATPSILLGIGGGALGHQAGDRPQTSAQKYKNIKVLKNLPADQLIPVMHQINLSLGVQCTFCHVIETDAAGHHVGFEKDDKPTKDVARKMMVMTNSLNAHERILDHQATCYMCHHGHAEPDTKAPQPEAPGR